ncbi:hypothetical protein B6N60_01700 [Richelia sinica FACHB-800]|uniref:Uncharacterized protein n=1 Tax=Richelia sinica FACHB-800 TaxID=1357546 RepID=A0A975T7Q9_9NOST|nr:hypothetical protein B6N60_01700 [Richelia sinica FACHB-800]
MYKRKKCYFSHNLKFFGAIAPIGLTHTQKPRKFQNLWLLFKNSFHQ